MAKLNLQVKFAALDNLSGPFKSINSKIAKNKELLQNSNNHLNKMKTALAGVQAQQQRLQGKGIRVSNALMNSEKSLQQEIMKMTKKIIVPIQYATFYAVVQQLPTEVGRQR